MMTTEPGQVLQRRWAAIDERDLPMVDLESASHIGTGYDARSVPFHERRPQWSGDRASEMADRGHVHPVGDDEIGNGISHQGACRFDRNRADPWDLADIAVVH
jgi:hypothetical protein